MSSSSKSLKTLKSNLIRYTTIESIENSPVNTKENKRFFIDKGLSQEDAQACLYALIFYTGSGSDHANVAASIEAKKTNSKIDLSVYKS